MHIQLKSTNGRSLRHTSGEELLLFAVFGPSSLKPRIDRELDRRVLVGTVPGRSARPRRRLTWPASAA